MGYYGVVFFLGGGRNLLSGYGGNLAPLALELLVSPRAGTWIIPPKSTRGTLGFLQTKYVRSRVLHSQFEFQIPGRARRHGHHHRRLPLLDVEGARVPPPLPLHGVLLRAVQRLHALPPELQVRWNNKILLTDASTALSQAFIFFIFLVCKRYVFVLVLQGSLLLL